VKIRQDQRREKEGTTEISVKKKGMKMRSEDRGGERTKMEREGSNWYRGAHQEPGGDSNFIGHSGNKSGGIGEKGVYVTKRRQRGEGEALTRGSTEEGASGEEKPRRGHLLGRRRGTEQKRPITSSH